jgi:MFS transporter, DHA1 family, inner membrane transport protein
MQTRFPPALVILVLWAAGLGAAAQFGKISVLFDLLGQSYRGHSAVQLGLIVSIVGFVGLIFGTTAGLLVARIGPRRVIVTALCAGAAMSALQASGLGYGAMIASRVVEGLSHLSIVVVGPTMIAGLASDRYRGLAMTLWSTFFGLTYALLALFAPALIAAHGAAGLFLLHALWMALMAVCLAVLLPRDPPAPVVAGHPGILAQHAQIYRSPRLSAPALGFFCYTFLYVALLTLLPSQVPLAQRALVAAGMPLISIALSLTLGVWLLGRMPAVRMVQTGYAMAAIGFAALWLFWGQGMGMALAALWVAASLGLVQGASFASIPQLNASADSRARASGAIAQLGNLGTTTGTPVLAAVLAGWGSVGLSLISLTACALGIILHTVQEKRRQTCST